MASNNVIFNQYNLINVSNKLLYVEGHRGILNIQSENISFKVDNAVISVTGNNLLIKYISEKTLCIQGKIKQVETI